MVRFQRRPSLNISRRLKLRSGMIYRCRGRVPSGMEFLGYLGAGVFNLTQLLLPSWLVKPILKPIVRVILGLLVIPVFRLVLHRVVRIKELDEELEKDISDWLRGAILLLIATSNMESVVWGWIRPEFRDSRYELFLLLRLLLAVGVIEGMPDQALFSIIHPGPPPMVLRKGRRWADFKALIVPSLRGLFNQHLNRSSAVLAILSVVLDPGPIGWVCYGLAITNYLIIGLICSRDKALNVLSQFDRAVSARRHEIELAVLKHDNLSDNPPDQRPLDAPAAPENVLHQP
jgi:hypothetical protein